MKGHFGRLRSGGFLLQSAVLGLVVAIVCGLVAVVAGFLAGTAGIAAATLAAALCLAGAVVALLAVRLGRGPHAPLVGMLLGMAARMAIPLGGGLACHLHGGPLVEAGLLYYLLIFYPITLTLETSLTLPWKNSAPWKNGAPWKDSTRCAFSLSQDADS